MIARRQARQARHLSDDIDRLTRGAAPRDATIDPEHRALLNAAALLDREFQGLRHARPGYRVLGLAACSRWFSVLRGQGDATGAQARCKDDR